MSEDPTRDLPALADTFAQILAETREIKSRLTVLEEKVEARFYDTRPIQEQALVEILEVKAYVTELQTGQEKLREDLSDFRKETNTNLKLVQKQLGHAFGDIGELRGEMSALEDRITSLEPPSA